MAEAAAAATVIQFLDFGARLLCTLSQICSSLRDVPDRIHGFQGEIRQLLALATSALQTPSDPTANAGPSLDVSIQSIWADCVKDAAQLMKILESLSIRSEHNVLEKSWRAILSVKKETEILAILKRLERHKSTLALWINNDNQ